VELFFVLSGFLIGGILLKKFKNVNLSTIFNFYKNRWFRTLPNYYLFLLINILFSFFLFKRISVHTPKYFFFIQNLLFDSNSEGFFGESWSLAIEEWFYLLCPVIIIIISFLKVKNKVLISAFILLLSSLVLKYIQFVSNNYDPENYDVLIRKVTILRMDSISTGLILAWVKNTFPNVFIKFNFKYICLILGVIFLLYRAVFSSSINDLIFWDDVVFRDTFNSIAISLLFPFFYSLRYNFDSNIFTKLITWVSLISYSMYLVHYSIINQTIKAFFWPDNGYMSIFLFIMYFLLTLIISTLNFIFFETKVTKLRDKIHFS
jgi:peptidoglycan/LPS O-acetylase OafA/YrhL